MPPPVPIYTLDCKGRTQHKGVYETRSAMFFAQIELKGYSKISVEDQQEFGKIVYGPPRQGMEESVEDFKQLESSAYSGSSTLRRLIARLSPFGGTKSHPSPAVWPVQAGAPKIHVQVSRAHDQEIRGVRRSNVSCAISRSAPALLMERVLDVLTDLLSCAVDSQLGLVPSLQDLMGAIKFALSREGGVCPISDSMFNEHIVPLIASMVKTEPWSILKEPDPATDDEEVIHNFLLQFLDKARRADFLGERKQLKRFRKEVRMRKKLAHTVFVRNLPLDATVDAVFALFNSVASNAVYKVDLPKTETGESKGYGFVICRSKKATDAVIAHPNWKLNGRELFVSPREKPQEDDPCLKKCRMSLPSELEEVIVKVVRQHPGCNASRIPGLIYAIDSSLSLDPKRLGFRNLTHALQSVPQIYLEFANRGNAQRPVYFVYPK